MRLSPASGSVIMRGRIQWIRCGFKNTALLDDMVTLAPEVANDQVLDNAIPFAGNFSGLFFDRHCRVFHPKTDNKTIEYALWGRQSSLHIQQDAARHFEITGPESETGGFGTDTPLPKSVVSLTCDEADYLYIADPETPALWVVDTWQHETARRIDTAGKPLDVAYAKGSVYTLLDTPGWFRVTPCEPACPLPWPDGLEGADRLDVTADGQGFVLLLAGQAAAELVSLQDATLRLPVPFCTDFLIGANDPEFGWLLVFSRRPGEDFLRQRLKGRHFTPLNGLQAPQYDGRGIALAPDGRIAYWTSRGLRHAAPARTQYVEKGLIYGFALDSDNDQNEWGTIALEACIPEGTQIRLHAFTRDDLDYADALARTAPHGETLSAAAHESSTPLVSLAAWVHATPAGQSVFHDPSSRPLSSAAMDGFSRYETPAITPPGRFLWLVIELIGTRSKTPKLRSARVDYPAHELVRQLPRTLWREPAARDFLTRYLAPMAAIMTEWGHVSDKRQLLLTPRVSPVEALEWVGRLLGLSMDQCWPERARRQMLEEVSQLFRIRGTSRSLIRMIEILTGAQVILIEKFRLRGGGVAGNPAATESSSVLGGGFRVGGSIGKDEDTELTLSDDEAFDTFAHRFSITIVASLGTEQLQCVRRLIETHKPAHTAFDVCTIATGTRVGVGLHIGISSAIGKSSGFELFTLGDSVLGKGYVLGRPELNRPASATQCAGEDA